MHDAANLARRCKGAAMDTKNAPASEANESAKIPPALYHDTSDVIGRVLGALLRGEHLTSNSCLSRFASSRLAHHIWQLQEDGWQILSQFEEVITTDAGRPARIKVYWLNPEDIAAAGENGKRYAKQAWEAEIRRKAGYSKPAAPSLAYV